VLSVVVCLLASSRPALAQSEAELLRQADAAAATGLPGGPLRNKIREGIAKGHDPKQIEAVISQMVQRMTTADRLVREVEPGATQDAREAAVALLEQALANGLTFDEIRELQRQAQGPILAQDLAGAARGLSFIKDARLPVNEGTGVMAEAVRQKFRAYEMLDIGREVKRREADYRDGRATLRALRDAIARGARPETLLRDSRSASADRPALTRPEAATDRPDRATPPVERPQRPDRPPDRPASSGDRSR
jgi:hypothetical protein